MKKQRPMLSGKIEEIIYARLERGEDLLRALWDICEQNDVKTGVLLDATGSLDNVRMMRFPNPPREADGDYIGIDFVDIPGPLEVSAHGIIGMGWVQDNASPGITGNLNDTGFGTAGFEGHKTPYLHVHITVSNAWETVCGHLLEGSHTGTDKNNTVHASLSHFTVAIAKVSEVILRATRDKTGYYHELVRA